MIVYCLLCLLVVAKCTVILGKSRSGDHTLQDFSRVHDEQLPLLKPASQDKFKVATASFGTLVADNTFSRVEGENTVVTHLTMAPGFDGHHYDKDGEHHGRKLEHIEDQKWENPSCGKKVVLVGDCHSNNGAQNYSALLTDVVDRWNNVPQNQDLTGATFTPSGITLQKATCDGDTKKTCDNDEVSNRISSCNGDYGDTGWSGLASSSYYIRTNFLIKVRSQVNEYYDESNARAQHTLCQEIGHGISLGHQDESGADFKTCMDYSITRPSSRYPNQHDVEVLDKVYGSCPPTSKSVAAPTSKPVAAPTSKPVAAPTRTPSPSPIPTSIPSPLPTPNPSALPTNTRTPSFVPSAMPSPEAGSPTMEPTVKTTQTMSATQALTGIDVATADSTEFKTRYAESVKVTLGNNCDSVVVTSVTATRRHLLSSSVIIKYTVIATNTAVTDIQVALMKTVDTLKKEINGYGYTVIAAVPTAFVDMSPTSMPTASPSPESIASNANAGGLGLTNMIIISVVFLFISVD